MNAGQVLTQIISERGEPTTWDGALETVLECQRRVMIDRQNTYGPQNIADQGLFGVLTRGARDKLARILGSLNGRIIRGGVMLELIADAEEEDGFLDGLIDSSNYTGPIAIMVFEDWWKLPRRSPMKKR